MCNSAHLQSTTEVKMEIKLNSKYKFLAIQDLLSLTGFSRSTINLKIANGNFPKPSYQSQNKRLWKESDYKEWVDSLVNDVDIARDAAIEEDQI